MLSGKFKLDALKREVEQGGYKGEKVVFLGATDVARISAICQVGADVLSKIGLNVDYVTTDWGTVVQRITRKQPIAEGGWSIFGSMWGGYDWYSPAGNAALRGNGMNAWFGWPDAPKLEALRDQWLREPRHGPLPTAASAPAFCDRAGRQRRSRPGRSRRDRSTAATSVANNISRRRADSVTANSCFRAILHNHKRRAPATVWRITAQLARCRYIVLLDEVERRPGLG